MAQNDWTVVSETPATEASGWEVASESPATEPSGWVVASETPVEKPSFAQRIKSALVPTPKEGPTVGISDEMTEALKAVTEPEVRPKRIGSVLEQEVVEPARGAGFMLRPDFVQEVRSSFANVPAERRRSALEEAAKATDATGQAARRILEEVRAEDERRRVDLLGRERMVGILAEAPKKPVLSPIGEGGGRVQFPDVTPTFAEEIDRLKVPEEERIQRRLARDEAERAVEAADRSMAAQAEREEQQRGFFDQLTKSFVDVGIPQAEAGFKGLTLVAQADRISKATDRLRALEAAGEGESREADGLRKTIEFYTKRQGEYFKGLAETQAELRTAPAYAGIRKLIEAKTLEEGFRAFAQDPINIVANLTAQSMPSMLPGLVLGVINPGLGAAAMGGSSFGVEFGGSLLEFAQEKGVDTSDPAQMAQFFDNKELLREGMNKAGTRAGIIGAGDLFLAGLASKTLVPKRITGPVAKNITNLGVQMGTQAVGGGGFEALAQIATEGEITKPGEVLAEMLGELGGAPAEVYTQTRQAARDVARERALRAAASAPPPPPPPPALSDEDRQLLLDHAQQRLAELQLKAEGTEERVITTPEGKKVRLPAEAAQFLTDDERAELAFLRGNATNPTALGRVYEIGTEEEEAPPPPVSPTITRMREQQRATEELEGEALGTETTKALQTETQGPEETATELADRIAAAEAEDTGFRPLTEAQSRRMAALSPSEREAMGFPVTPRALRPAVKVSENPENIGMTGLDEANRPVVDLITAGAKPFPTKKAAEMGKAQRPDMKILKVANGWMLTPMTEADVARGERAGQRISAFQPGKAGMPTAAHEYIMERGGLTFDQQPNTDFPDENPKVGNRRLFSDKGMSLAQAAELLKEAGYIDEETETAAQAAISNSVKGKRVYTPEGYERAATLEKEAQTREAERAETEAGLYTPEADIYDYRYLEDPFRMPIAEVRTRAEAVGIPYDVIAEDVASRMPDATQEEYEDAVKTEVSNYAKSEGKFLSIEQRTETPEFKGWFGDSKVVDESGKPLVVYHHTPESFDGFIPGGRDPEMSGVAIWMTPERDVSRAPFGHQLYTVLRQGRGIDAKGNTISADAVRRLESGKLTDQQAKVIRKRIDEAIDAARMEGVNTMPLYVSLKNPLILRGPESSKITLMYPDRVAELRSQGYDGVMAYDKNGNVTEIAVFDPQQVKSAIGNRGTFDPTSPNILESIQSDTVQPGVASRSPSLKRKVKFLNKQREDGRLTDQQFAKEVSDAIDLDEANRRRKPATERVRGADFIRQKLLEAKRRGDLSAEAVDFAEWFIRNNEALVDDLGIAIKSPKERGTAGQYNPMLRIMVLMKESAGDNTVVHEILHHLERMMPAEVQAAIRKEWLGRFLRAKRAAKTPTEKLYFELLLNHHFGSGKTSDVKWPAGSEKLFDRLAKMGDYFEFGSSYQTAIEMLRQGIVPSENLYQYVNPSEFWSVNGTDIMQGRFNAIRGGTLTRLKQWLKELGEKIKSLFGLKSDAPLIKALDSLAKGDGEFVSKDMLMDGDTFLQVGRNIYNRRPLVQWNTPDETKLDTFIYRMQDKLVDTKRVIQDIERATGAIDDRWNPYLQEELYHGRTATATKDFLASEVRPLLDEMRKENVSIADLEEYLHNRFAETRNNNIAQINPTMPDGGSGIMTADAQAYLAALTPEQKRKYERLASKVYAITQGTRDYLVGSGLEEQDTINAWESSSPDYVPLNRGDVEYSTTVGTGTGQGYSVKGPSTRTATGSLRPVVNILANVIAQRERAIVRGEKNRVATALYGLALQNPNPEFWLAVNPDATKNRRNTTDELINMGLTPAEAEGLMQEPAKKVVDPQTGLVTQRINPVLRNADNVLAVRINGKDRFVFFNTTNPRAVRMVTALKNLDADQLGGLLKIVAVGTRYFSKMNTQYNLVFGIYNFLRDYQGGAIQLSGTPLADSRAKVLNPLNIRGAMQGIWSTVRAERARRPQLMTPWADLWIDFTREGGQTGYLDMFSRTEERANALKKELDRLSEGKASKVVKAAPRALFNWLSDVNEMLENAVRLSAYKAALDKGLSKEQAASLAKNITVNFNRKGQVGTHLGALYSFFNSSIQGTARLLGTVAKMERPGDIKSLRLRKAGKVIVYGGLLLGVLQALLLSAFDFDEDEPKDFVKDRNLILPIGWLKYLGVEGSEGKYLAWPLPLGYHVIPAFSRIITEWALSGGKKTGKMVTHLVSLLADAFNPIGNAGISYQSIAPTVSDPIVAIMENKDWTGKEIAKKDFNQLDPTPGYTRAKQNSSWIGDELAYFINALTGGDADKPGEISPTPDQIDYLIGQAFGGVGREVVKAGKTIKALTTGEELPPYNIPLVGRFYGNSKAGYAESQRFYENIKELNILHNQLEGRQKRKEDPAKFLQENPKVRLYEAAMATQRNVQNLRKQRDALIERDAPKESVKAVENNITNQMKKLNEKVKQFETKNKKEPAPTE